MSIDFSNTSFTCVSKKNNNIGIDIVHIEDMESFLLNPVDVILTQGEWEEIKSSINVEERLAGKFAAKEAIMKVLEKGIDFLEFCEIEILNEISGKPLIYLRGKALQEYLTKEINSLNVSISHHKTHAVAVAVTE